MNIERLTQIARERSTAISCAVLACLAYIPALTAAPGKVPSDSKLYVYLNPGRFISDTTTTFDPRQFAGWVPHQHIAYLWPTGPWFWFFERLGVPDWIAHRLWIGTLLVLAGLGVRWLARVLGLSPLAALVAALVYQLSPYVLPYISRTSVLLLPWAGLGWIVGLTVLASIRGRWRYTAAIALVVLTVGAVNATALAMIIPAPALWLVHATLQRTITWRRAVATAGKVALLATGVSLWWMAMLVIQGRRGADVLAYSESLESVSFTSTSTEAVRGLGYWLFYIRDSFAATTTASIDHLISIKVVLAGFVLVGICLLGIVTTRWAHRRFAALLVGVGVVLAVGVHPIDDPSPLMSLLLGDGEGGLALALRSSTRAVPVLVLGLALGAAALVSAVATVSLPRLTGRHPALALATVIGLLAVYNLPALRTGGFVDPALERDQDVPAAWLDAAAQLDAAPNGYRVLQLPGTEFGAFQWGYTVDQPLPALTERPLLTRDLLPLGSPAAMDLLFALDDRVQDGTIEVASIAPVARLLGVDTIWVSDDVQFDRFRLARPELVDDALTNADALAAGLLPADRFGTPVAMSPQVEYIDEQSLSNALIGQPLATVSLVGVINPVPTVRVKDQVVVLSGSGDGIVDSAAAGLIDGNELIRYTASLSDQALADAISTASSLIVTDSNRDRAHHWRSSQDVLGATETGGPGADVLRFEPADQRLPVFDTTNARTQTIAIQEGPARAAASAYGEPFAYLPEHRPAMAIDGDLATSWTVSDRAPAVGEFIRIDIDQPIDRITLRQPDALPGSRVITRVSIEDASGSALDVPLTEESLSGVGQRVDIIAVAGSVTITIEETSAPQPPIAEAIGAVGFAEIGFGLEPTVEFIRPPHDALDVVGPETPVSFVFNRLRADPQDRFRSDPEPVMRREFDLQTSRTLDGTVTLRVPARANDALLSTLLNEPVDASGHLAGTPTARGAAAFDTDTASSWITPFDQAIGSWVTVHGTGMASSVQITQPGGPFSAITEVQITDAGGTAAFAVQPGATDLALPRPYDLSNLTVAISAIDERVTVDRRFGEPVAVPAAIADITFDGTSLGVTPSISVDTACRTDLLAADTQPIGLAFELTVDDVLSGRAIDATFCSPATQLDGATQLDAGTHRLTSTSGFATGFDVDTVVLTDQLSIRPSGVIDPGEVVLVESDRLSRTVDVPACPVGCWVVLGEGFNEGWGASRDGTDLGASQLVDGNANGWWIAPTTAPTTVTIRWTAQRLLTIALVLSLIATLACAALVVFDRRREGESVLAVVRPTFARDSKPARSGTLLAAVGLTCVSAAVLIGWSWLIPALAVSALAYAVGRTRLLAFAGLLVVSATSLVVVYVVGAERPFPNAGWPIRFEWLHGWTLLGLVFITCSTLFAPDAMADDAEGDAAGDDADE